MTRNKLIIMAVVVGILMLGTIAFSPMDIVAAQDSSKNAHGAKLYMQYCASCHGNDGKGGGPVTASLKTPVPDLTTIAKREGKFNGIRVREIIAGEIGTTAHGEKDMPVWGYIFRNKVGSSFAYGNIYALMKYIESIQAK